MFATKQCCSCSTVRYATWNTYVPSLHLCIFKVCIMPITEEVSIDSPFQLIFCYWDNFLYSYGICIKIMFVSFLEQNPVFSNELIWLYSGIIIAHDQTATAGNSCYTCSREVVYKHSCIKCRKVICTFPSCSAVHEEDDFSPPVYFCKNCSHSVLSSLPSGTCTNGSEILFSNWIFTVEPPLTGHPWGNESLAAL